MIMVANTHIPQPTKTANSKAFVLDDDSTGIYAAIKNGSSHLKLTISEEAWEYHGGIC